MRALAISCLILMLAACGPFSSGGTGERDWFELEVVSATGLHRFIVEIADTPQEQSRGLMFRRTMAPDAGMLFLYEEEVLLSFWMRNTYISLDIIYIDRGGRIVSIARETEPLSDRSIPSGTPAIAVLEVNAGTAERLGFFEGDIVRHPFFGNYRER